jgi:uncharacterized protein YgiM (DUF1202 family)
MRGGSTLGVPEGDAHATSCGETSARVKENEVKDEQSQFGEEYRTQNTGDRMSPGLSGEYLSGRNCMKSDAAINKANLNKDAEYKKQDAELNAKQTQSSTFRIESCNTNHEILNNIEE